MKMMPTVVLTISLLTAVVVPAQAQFDAVGSLDFPTSSSGDVEQHFLRGVAILHSFGWVQARTSSRRRRRSIRISRWPIGANRWRTTTRWSRR